MRNVGFIGLGKIGNPMAATLLKSGYRLAVYDLDRSCASNLIEMGAVWAGSPREAVAKAEVLITSLPGPPASRLAVEGADGIMAGAAPGAVWIEMSTTELEETQKHAARLAELGVETIEAPVTGGVANARIGKITIFVGGPEKTYARVSDVLAAMGSTVLHLGPLGTASVAKLVTNFICFVHEIALGEGLVLAARSGLDPISMVTAIQASYGDSFVARVDSPQIFAGTYAPDFSLDLACKDMALTLRLAEKAGIELEAASLADRLYRRARDQYGGGAGCLHVVRLLEDRTGTSLRAASRPRSDIGALGG